MRRALLGTTALALSLLVAGAGAAAASTDALSPSPSPSASDAPATDLDESESPAPSPSPSVPSTAPSDAPEDDTAALEPTQLQVPTYTCDADPRDDFVLPADTAGVTYTLENDTFVATLNEGYQWADWFFNDPYVDPAYSNFGPGFRIPEVGPTEPIAIPVADMAFPNCNYDDETTVSATTECVDGTGYLDFDIDAAWATDEVEVDLHPYTRDEALRGHVAYRGTGLSGHLAWDGSTPGMRSDLGPLENTPDVYDPIFWVHNGEHGATVKLDIAVDDPCLGVDPGNPGDPGDGDDNAAGGDDDELAATGPEAAWLTTGAAALLVAVGTTLVVVRRRMSA